MKTTDYFTLFFSVVSMILALYGVWRANQTDRRVTRLNVEDKRIEALKLLSDLLTRVGDRHIDFINRCRDFTIRVYDTQNKARGTISKKLMDEIRHEWDSLAKELETDKQTSNKQIDDLGRSFDFFANLTVNTRIDELDIRRRLIGAYQIYYGTNLVFVGLQGKLNGAEYMLNAWQLDIAADAAQQKADAAQNTTTPVRG